MDGILSQKSSMDEAMAEVLQQLTKVAEFLRNAGHNAGANHVAKLSIELVEAFHTASAELEVPGLSEALAVQNLTEKAVALHLSKKTEKDGQGEIQPFPAGQSPSQASRTALRKISEGVFQHKQTPRGTAEVRLRHKKASKRTQKLASVTADSSAPNTARLHGGVPLHVSEAASALCALRSSFSSDNESLLKSRQNSVQSRNENLEEGFAGVVHIYGDSTRSNYISFVTSRISEGPVYEVSVISPDETMIIFQYALHAQVFVDRNQECLVLNDSSVLGQGYVISLSEPLEWHDTLKRMEHPVRERRRLTFARAKLFGEQLPCKKWQREIADIAGPSNVDFTWVFNNGNATAVFRSTGIARKVLHTFQSWKVNRPVYSGLDVSFSADPCEKELVLSSQIRHQSFAPWKATPR